MGVIIMPVFSWVRRLFDKKVTKTIVNARMPRRRTRLDVEPLESRLTPSAAPSATLQLVSTATTGISATAATLSLDTYSFGFANNVNIGSVSSGAGAGKATFNHLTLTAPLNGNSPKLFKTLAAGASFSQAYLTQNDAAGNPVAVWILKPVYLDSDKIDGDGSVIPEETIQFKFRAVTETTKINTQSWDQVTNQSGTGSPLPTGETLAAVPTPAPTDASLRLYATASGAPAITIALDSYQFQFEHATTVGSATAQKGGGLNTKLDSLEVGASFSEDSPTLLNALTTGTHYDHAVLVQNNATGQATTAWTMKLVFNTEDDIAGQSGSLPTENFHFAFSAITESVQPNPIGSGSATSVSWDQVLHATGTVSSLPPDISLVAIPTPVTSPITLTVTPSTGDKTPITIPLDAYTFSASKSANIGSASSGAGAGKVKFDELIVNADFSKNSLVLFQSLTAGLHFTQAVLAQNTADGQPIASWTLNTVFVTSEKITGQNGDGEPTEEVHLAYNAETEASGAASATWNQVTNKGSFTVTPPTGVVPDSIITPPITLQLTPAGGDKTPFTIPVNSYDLGFDKPVVIGSATSGAGAAKGKFEDLIIQADFGPYSPKLFQATAAGTLFGSAVLTQNDGAGNPIAVWTFNVVLATSDTIIGSAGDLPKESIHFVFGSETEATKEQIASFDQVRNQGGTLGANPNGATLDTIAPSPGFVTLQLTPGVGGPGRLFRSR